MKGRGKNQSGFGMIEKGVQLLSRLCMDHLLNENDQAIRRKPDIVRRSKWHVDEMSTITSNFSVVIHMQKYVYQLKIQLQLS
jgi:hypothetical protein